MMPIILYIFYTVILGGAVEGDVIYLDTFAPTKKQAITELVVIVTIFILGLMLEHYGTKAIDKLIKKEPSSKT